MKRGTLLLRCPECGQGLEGSACANGHAYPVVNGVLQLLAPAFRLRVEQFNACLEEYRAAEGKRHQQDADELNPRHDGFHVHR